MKKKLIGLAIVGSFLGLSIAFADLGGGGQGQGHGRSELVQGTGFCSFQLPSELALCTSSAEGDACNDAVNNCLEIGVVAAGCEVECEEDLTYPYSVSCTATVGCTLDP